MMALDLKFVGPQSPYNSSQEGHKCLNQISRQPILLRHFNRFIEEIVPISLTSWGDRRDNIAHIKPKLSAWLFSTREK